MKALVGRDIAISNQRGRWQQGPHRAPMMITFHPSYVLRFSPGGHGRIAEDFRDDLLSVKRAISGEDAASA